MPSSEIDAIFASKVKPTRTNAASSRSEAKVIAVTDPDKLGEKKSKKKKKKTDKNTETIQPSLPAATAKRKQPEPETIVDPSILVAPLPKKKNTARLAGNGEANGKLAKKKPIDEESDEKFRDSRGTGPRRKTEDGFSIYKEDELGIGDEGGDTPLCPFDCDCCF